MSEQVLVECRFDLNATEIEEQGKEIIAACRAKYDQIGQSKSVNFNDVVKEMSLVDVEYGTQIGILAFHQYVAQDEKVREAARQLEKSWNEFQIESSQREDHYRLFKEVASQKIERSPVDQRLLDHSLRNYRRKGLELSSETRQRLKELLNRQSELGIQFQKTNSEDTSHVMIKTDDLTGVDDDFLKRTLQEDGQHKITAKYPDVFPIFNFCQNEETRRRVMEMFEGRSQENFPILVELCQIRQEMAKLLGYPNNAEFRMELQMTKTAGRVQEFLNEVLSKLAPTTAKYVKELSEMKGSELQYWDYSFFHQKNLKENFQVDHQLLKEYFPAEHVVAEMLGIYAEIFHLNFNQLTPPSTWNSQETSYFSVDDSRTGQCIGYFYMDLHPREGKYTHAAMWDLVGGSEERQTGKMIKQRIPVAALLCNFSPPSEEKPSLLTFSEVNTLFHEFGHVIHGLCGGYKAKYGDFAGTNVETDFVEAPSQMIEQWLWEPVVLQRIGRHYSSEEPIPKELLDKLIATKYVGQARDWTRQAVLALTDQTLFSQGKWTVEEMKETFRAISDKYMGYSCGTGRSLASWGHLAGGYDAKYYSYIWSRVIAADLYSRFSESGNPLNPDVGLEYREKILEPGGSLDGDQMVHNYLGREMKIDAFLRTMGVE